MLIHIGSSVFSPAFWKLIWAPVDLSAIEALGEKNDGGRTGAVNRQAMTALYSLSRFVRPKVIVEVGTFSGRSGMSLLAGSPQAVLHTCDYRSPRPDFGGFSPKFYPVEDHEMFGQVGKADLIFLDGRLTDKGVETLPSLCHENTVLAVDDFEGLEKGVANLMRLSKKLKFHLITPPEGCTIAVALPLGSLKIGTQTYAERVTKASPIHGGGVSFAGIRPQGWNQAIGSEGI